VLAKSNPCSNRASRPAGELTDEEKLARQASSCSLDKPTIFACNVKEGDLATADSNPFVQKVREYVKAHLACERW
jgi:ribosome-binding ATPase YchF (GTP1/OBG family)